VNAPEKIETPLLVLRKPRADDAEAIFEEYASDPEVTRYLLFRPPSSRRGWRAGAAARRSAGPSR
jgi:RimJ/RimL family protein N-acetyltransferase